jgi:predicted acetyltransferase
MGEIIRNLRFDELETFNRFLERSYGHKYGLFKSAHALRDPDAVRCNLVVERDGHIVSHVGTYPMDIIIGSARILCAGVGGVATHPEERGKGYMSGLMEESLRKMREEGYHISALWGNQQRYSNFGYETCGIEYKLTINRRSLEHSKVQPVLLEEVDPQDEDVIKRVRELHSTLSYRVEPKHFDLRLLKYNVRVFLGPDGYLLSRNERAGDLEIHEVVSPTHQEAGLILGTLNWTFGSSASLRLEPGDVERANRLLQVSSYWSAMPQGMFRIIHWPKLLTALNPILTERALGLPDFSIAIGCKWQSDVEVATIAWDGSSIEVSKGRHCDGYIEVDERLLVTLLLGGPCSDYKPLGLFGRLLPVPLHIPIQDHL